jgi:glutamate-ammonia-ligase adenylyltransferase
MRQQLDKSDENEFDLKQGIGGITDIEFMVQYAVLAWAHDLPELLLYTDNIRILQTLVAAGKLNAAEGELMENAYLHYRQEANRRVMQELPTRVVYAQVGDYPQQIRAIWQRWLDKPSPD